MRSQHILTFNEETYTISDGLVRNTVFINGLRTDWFVEFQHETFDGISHITGLKVKNMNDENPSTFYYHSSATSIQLHTMVEIIQTIKENSLRNK